MERPPPPVGNRSSVEFLDENGLIADAWLFGGCLISQVKREFEVVGNLGTESAPWPVRYHRLGGEKVILCLDPSSECLLFFLSFSS